MISDCEYVMHFGLQIAEEYKTASEFIAVSPYYACLCLRRAGEALCEKLATKHNIIFNTNNFESRINYLRKNGVIDVQAKDSFHKMRIICNAWVHKNFRVSERDGFESNFNEIEIHIEEVRRARRFFLDVADRVFDSFFPEKINPEYSIVNIDKEIHKILLYNACILSSAQTKLKAGVVYEAMGDEQGNLIFDEDAPNSWTKKGLVCPEHEYRHYTYLYELAAESYDSACGISALAKDRSLSANSLLEESGENRVAAICDIEALFRYGALTCEGRLGEGKKLLGINRLRVAAERGHVEAAAVYGAALYNDGKYEQSHIFLQKAAERDDVCALRFLYYYYSEGSATLADHEIAIGHIQRAIQLGCAEALAIWGQAHFKGASVKKNAAKGNLILEQAKKSGSIIAAKHFTVQKITRVVQERFDKLGKALSAIVPPKIAVAGARVGRNELCHCGSGKKYKRCCGQ
jgi:tetratricopeptide (TPR) repeat protein